MSDQKTETIGWRKALATMQCKLAAAAGYVPRHPLGGTKFFSSWPPEARELKGQLAKPSQAAEWILSTSLYAVATARSEFPARALPSAREGAYWSKGDKKQTLRAKVEVLGSEVWAKAQIPALRKSQDGWEAVYVDRRKQARGPAEWASALKLLGWNQACFEEATGQPLTSRIIAPARESERVAGDAPTSLQSVLVERKIQAGAARPEPGPHCRHTSEGAYRCPLRESRKCTPYESLS